MKEPGLISMGTRDLKINELFMAAQEGFEARTVKKKEIPGYPDEIAYYFNPEKNCLVLTAPLKIAGSQGLDAGYTLFSAKLLNHIRRIHPGCHILAGLRSDGISEAHILTLYQGPETAEKAPSIQLFDSKVSDLTHFLAPKPGLGGKVKRLFQGLWRALQPHYLAEGQVDGIPVKYEALGTQSLFDMHSCGYHTAATIAAIAELLPNIGEKTLGYRLREHFKQKNPVQITLDQLNSARAKNIAPESAREIHWFAFLKHAWHESMIKPHIKREDTEADIQALHFRHYFFGWPRTAETWQIYALYFLNLSFIIKPLSNAFSLVLEFPLKVLAESLNWAKSHLETLAPMTTLGQYARSMLLLPLVILDAMAEGLRLLVRTLTSPLQSHREAKDKHPLLGFFSASLSLLNLSILGFFASPALIAFIPVAIGNLALFLEQSIISATLTLSWGLTLLGLNFAQVKQGSLENRLSPCAGFGKAEEEAIGNNPEPNPEDIIVFSEEDFAEEEQKKDKESNDAKDKSFNPKSAPNEQRLSRTQSRYSFHQPAGPKDSTGLSQESSLHRSTSTPSF